MIPAESLDQNSAAIVAAQCPSEAAFLARLLDLLLDETIDHGADHLRPRGRSQARIAGRSARQGAARRSAPYSLLRFFDLREFVKRLAAAAYHHPAQGRLREMRLRVVK